MRCDTAIGDCQHFEYEAAKTSSNKFTVSLVSLFQVEGMRKPKHSPDLFSLVCSFEGNT